MSTLSIILTTILAFGILYLVLYWYFSNQQKKTKEFAQQANYKYYRHDKIQLRKHISPTLFFASSRKPYPFDIIDTGNGILFKVTMRMYRYSLDIPVFTDTVQAPDLIISKRTPWSSMGFYTNIFGTKGFHEISVPKFSQHLAVFGKNPEKITVFMQEKGEELSAALGDFSVEVSDNTFLCYNFKKRPKIKDYQLYIEVCQEIRDIIKT